MAPASRIRASARSSRSAVVTPGTAAAVSASRVRPTTSPAARISSTSASLLIWIILSRLLSTCSPACRDRRRLDPPSVAEAPEGVDRPLCDVLHRTRRVDTAEQAAVTVVADEGRRLVRVDLQPVPDGVLAVVVALEELTAAPVALAGGRGRVEVEVPDVSAAPAGPAPGEPADDLVVVHHQLEDDVDRGVLGREQLVEHLGLVDRAWEAVEQEALGGVLVQEPVGDHPYGHLVGDEVPGVHVLLRLEPQVGALADVGPEDVARRDLRHREVRRDELSLGPLAGPGWSDEYEPH